MKNKKLKLALQSACIIALFCIIPTCVISCSNSQSSSNANTTNKSSNSNTSNNQNNNSSINFVDATASSANDDVTKSNYQSYLNSITNNALTTTQENTLDFFNSWVNVYTISNDSSSCSISLNNFSSNSYTTYSWHKVSETQWVNILQSNSNYNTYSQYQTEQNIIDACINYGTLVSNNETYTFNATIPSTGEYFVCVIKNSQNTWYSKPVLLYSSNSNRNNINNSNNQSSLINAVATSSSNNLTFTDNFQNYLNYLQTTSDSYYVNSFYCLTNWSSLINTYSVFPNSSSNYTLSISNFSSSSSPTTYSWYEISPSNVSSAISSAITNNDLSYQESNYQLDCDILNNCVSNGTLVSNDESYSFDGTIPTVGEFFVCQMQSNYSLFTYLCCLYPMPSNSLNISSYSLKLASKNSTVNNNGSIQINANQGEKVTFDLELQNQNNQNLTSSDFNKIKYYVQYVFTNQNTGTTITSTKLDLNQASSWIYSINSSGYWTVSVNVYNQNNKEIVISDNQNSYQIVSQYAIIDWENKEIKYQGSGTIQINNGTCYYAEASYQWQVSDNSGKSWSSLDNGSGQITDPLSLSYYTTNYNIKKESNNTLYRLEIINTNNPSEYFYSNSLSPNDSLVSANISFANNTYNQQQENSATYGAFISNDNDVDLVLSLSQFGKNTTNNELLKELSVSCTLTNWYNKQENVYNQQTYLNNTSNNLGVLSTFYNEKSNEIIITIPFSVFVDYEQQSITNYNYNINYSGTNCTQYKPITLSLTIDQNGNQISTNSLVVTPEIANIALASTKQFKQVNNTYYCTYGQSVTLNSNNSNINFPSTTTYQWQYSSNGTSNWEDVNTNGTNSSLTTNIEGNIYYRLDVGETAMGDVNIYSNVIHFDSSIPTATISFSSSNDYNDEVVTNFTQSFGFNADIVQNNEAINSNPNIKIMYQYQINNGKWINAYANALLLSPNNVFYQYACNQTGIINIRLKFVYNTIVQYSNTLTLYNIDPTLQVANNLNINNSNNFISDTDSTYTFNYGSNVALSLYNPAFNLSTVNQSYSIYQIQWFEKGNATALATYNAGEILDYPICVIKDATYYAIVTYTPTYGGSNVTSTSTPIIINSTNTNNQYVANITLNNASQLNSEFGSTTPLANEYYFLNSSDLLYNQVENIQNNSEEPFSQLTFPSFNLNLYYDGQELNNTSSNIKSGNWKVNWYVSLFNSSTNKWTQLQSFNSIYTGSWINSLNASYGQFSYSNSNGNLINKSCWYLSNFLPLTPNWQTITGYSFPSNIDSIPESDITNMRICALITAPTTSFYTNFYYLNIPTSLSIANN